MPRMRTFALLSLAALALSGNAACGGEETAAPPKAPPAPPVVASTPVPAPAPAPRVDPNLIPRDVLFGNPEHVAPQVSPDGKWLAYIGPVDGVLNVMVVSAESPVDFSKAKAVSHEKNRPVYEFYWTKLPGKLVYAQDAGGDENFHFFAIDAVKGGEARDITPYKGARADFVISSPKHPDEIAFSINDRDPKWPDVYRVNVVDGTRTLIAKNDAKYAGFEVDYDFKARFATRSEKDGSATILAPGKSGAFDQVFLTIPFDDSQTTSGVGFDLAGKKYLLVDSRNRDTAALAEIDMATKKETILASDPRADASLQLRDPRTRRPLLASVNFERDRHLVIDKAVQPDEDYLKTVVPDSDWDWNICSADFKRCVISFQVSDGPVRWYLYDRARKHADYLFDSRPKLEKVKLAKMLPEVIKSRDGLDLVSYLTLPLGTDDDGDGKPSHPLPMILYVHGGPWWRDSWGYEPNHQWLANRGYAVLSVNYRGSTGLGKKFLNAANLEWGGKMHDDLIDAVKWATASGIADPSKVGIFGGSYGGYATLVGMTFTPDTFACGADEVGVANLVTFQQTIPPYWEAGRDQLYNRVGDPRTEEGKKFLLSRSPISKVGDIKHPLLIAQGQNDPRVNHAESEQIVDAMKAKGIPVTYLLFPDEGHGFHRPENNKAFNAATETFFAQCLGGAYEPVGTSFDGSTITVPQGAAQVYGLPEALKTKK